MKLKIKMTIDILMTILLILLMMYQVIGQKLHEYYGVAMLTLFIIHHIWNINWYKNFFKGKYKTACTLNTIVNFALLVFMLCLGFSGIIIYRHVFTFLPINRSMTTARTIHMATSYWSFVLISVHLGLHWGMIIGIFQRLVKGKNHTRLLEFILRLVALTFSGYVSHLFCESRNNFLYVSKK